MSRRSHRLLRTLHLLMRVLGEQQDADVVALDGLDGSPEVE
jgi:hypothetical protein